MIQSVFYKLFALIGLKKNQSTHHHLKNTSAIGYIKKSSAVNNKKSFMATNLLTAAEIYTENKHGFKRKKSLTLCE